MSNILEVTERIKDAISSCCVGGLWVQDQRVQQKTALFTTLETLNTSFNYAGSLLVAVLWLNYKFYIQSLHSYILIHALEKGPS